MEQLSTHAITETGLQYVAGSRYQHPSAASHVQRHGSRGVLDLEKAQQSFQKTLDFIRECGMHKKTILFSGTRPECADILQETAIGLGMGYVNLRWVGGFLTNFPEISKRFKKMETMREQKESGSWERRYLKKEQLRMGHEYEKIRKKFEGIASLSNTPDVLFVIDPKREYIAVAEARKMNIPVIGFTNGNSDFSQLDYMIVGNNTARKSVEFVLNAVKNAYLQK